MNFPEKYTGLAEESEPIKSRIAPPLLLLAAALSSGCRVIPNHVGFLDVANFDDHAGELTVNWTDEGNDQFELSEEELDVISSGSELPPTLTGTNYDLFVDESVEPSNGAWSVFVGGKVNLSVEDWCEVLDDLNKAKIEVDTSFLPIQDTMWCSN